MKKWLTLTIAIILFALIAAYLYLKSEKKHHDQQDDAMFNTALNTLKAEDYSASEEAGMTRAAAMQKKAIENIETLIDDQPTLVKKRQTAASTFMGFYLTNVRTRSDFCANKGVDISLFRNAFANAHLNDYEVAKSLLFQTQADIDSFYQFIEEHSHHSIAQDMQDMANLLRISPEESCQILDTQAEVLIDEMKFSKVQPIAHEYLHKTVAEEE